MSCMCHMQAYSCTGQLASSYLFILIKLEKSRSISQLLAMQLQLYIYSNQQHVASSISDKMSLLSSNLQLATAIAQRCTHHPLEVTTGSLYDTPFLVSILHSILTPQNGVIVTSHSLQLIVFVCCLIKLILCNLWRM